jgi:hypothetical protein
VILIKLAIACTTCGRSSSSRGEATANRAGNARSLRAARAPFRNGARSVGARGSRVQAHRVDRVQGAREARCAARAEREGTIAQLRDPLQKLLNDAGITNVE